MSHRRQARGGRFELCAYTLSRGLLLPAAARERAEGVRRDRLTPCLCSRASTPSFIERLLLLWLEYDGPWRKGIYVRRSTASAAAKPKQWPRCLPHTCNLQQQHPLAQSNRTVPFVLHSTENVCASPVDRCALSLSSPRLSTPRPPSAPPLVHHSPRTKQLLGVVRSVGKAQHSRRGRANATANQRTQRWYTTRHNTLSAWCEERIKQSGPDR